MSLYVERPSPVLTVAVGVEGTLEFLCRSDADLCKPLEDTSGKVEIPQAVAGPAVGTASSHEPGAAKLGG